VGQTGSIPAVSLAINVMETVPELPPFNYLETIMFIAEQYFSPDHHEIHWAFRLGSLRKAPNYDTLKAYYAV
jgi:hypothetical protein